MTLQNERQLHELKGEGKGGGQRDRERERIKNSARKKLGFLPCSWFDLQ